MRKKLTPLAAERVFRDLVGDGVGGAYEWAARAPRTWTQYQSALRLFRAWCGESHCSPMPVEAATVRAYIHHLVESDRGVPSIRTLLSALATVHRMAGHRFDRRAFTDMVKGLTRLHGQPPRQARPLLAEDLQDLVSRLDMAKAADVRDAALLAFGWGGALRQAEIVGLDWAAHGKGDGVLVRDRRGLTITLIRSKTSQAKPVSVILPRKDMPTACEAIDRWVALAQLQPCEPVFRRVSAGRTYNLRLAADAVARIVKRRVYHHALVTGATEAEALQRRAAVSGHSLRSGCITEAALRGVPEWKIRLHSRHKSAEQVAVYVRAAGQWKDSVIRGVRGIAFENLVLAKVVANRFYGLAPFAMEPVPWIRLPRSSRTWTTRGRATPSSMSSTRSC